MVEILVFLVLSLGVWSYGYAGRRRRTRDDLDFLARADEEFRTLVVESEFPERCFDGSTAEIVDERQEGMNEEETGVPILRQMHRFARNAHGEYFFFVSEGSGKPFFKHVSQVNAKAALGKKYVAPPSTGA